MRALAIPWLAIAFAAAPIGPVAARAQIAFSAELASDTRLRGMSISDGRPTLALGAAYDHFSGLYAGASVLGQDTAHDGVQLLGFKENLGYAFREGRDWSVDVGLDNQDFKIYGPERRGYHYSEIYAGVATRGLAARVYYSPDYFLRGASTIYAQLSGAYRPADHWRLYASVGALTYLAMPPGMRLADRFDAYAGIAREIGPAEVRLEATVMTPRSPAPSTDRPEALIAAVSFVF